LYSSYEEKEDKEFSTLSPGETDWNPELMCWEELKET
jgi:hypothetical protein